MTLRYPSVYLFNETDQQYELFLGDFSTVDGLLLINGNTKISMHRFGSTRYKNYGWASERELPAFHSVSDFVSFLESEGALGLIDLEVHLEGVGQLSTHDDSECHFVVRTRKQCLSILVKAVPDQHRGILVNALVTNPGLYLSISAAGKVCTFSSFEEYVERTT